MRSDHFSWRGTLVQPPRLDESALPRQLYDSIAIRRSRPRGVAVGDEDLAARVDDHVGGSDERLVAGHSDACLAERHQQLALGRELEDLKAFARRLSSGVEGAAVGDPDVAAGIHVQAMRLQEQALAEALHELARSVEHEDRCLAPAALASCRGASPRGRRPMENPQVAGGVDVRVRDLAPREIGGNLCPTFDQRVGAFLGMGECGLWSEGHRRQADRQYRSMEMAHRAGVYHTSGASRLAWTGGTSRSASSCAGSRLAWRYVRRLRSVSANSPHVL